MSDGELPMLWRIKLRSKRAEVEELSESGRRDYYANAVEYCATNSLIGLGWPIDELQSNAPLDVVVGAIKNNKSPGYGPRAASMVHRFGAEERIDEFAWTRDTSGRYRLCRITGQYRYDISDTAKEVDAHHVRGVEWAPHPLNDLDVPGAVTRAFDGQGQAFAQIKDWRARAFTPYLWEKLHGRPLPELGITDRDVLTSYLNQYDVEDLVYVWLQVARGYVAIQSSRRRSTPVYEWTMIHPDTGRRCIAQVKTGSTHVDLEQLAGAAEVTDDAMMETYAFATCKEGYDGDPQLVSKLISVDELLRFVAQHRHVLPSRVQTWFELATT